MNKRYLVALDQGTTSSRAVVFTPEGSVVSSVAMEFKQIYPHPGWVEHDPEDIIMSQVESLRSAVRKAGISPDEIAAIGITNQRETTLLWERKSGKPVHNAIVWQCRRSAELVEALKKDGGEDAVRQKTGLIPDAYFSGTKLQWLLQNLDIRQKAEKGELCFGTVDSYLAFHLVKGHPHVTDATNAGRTMLFNLHTQQWDDELLMRMEIPKALLPQVVDTSHVIGMLDEGILGTEIPVASLVGDQHAALFGQACIREGMVKNTYGTGCFMLMNIGDQFRLSKNGLVTTMAWRLNGKPTYAYEGSVFMGGAAIQWLRDELKLIEHSSESEHLARSVHSTEGCYLVPAFTGLGAPHWSMYARGTMVGMTRGTSRAHMVRAALESIAYQSNDLLSAMVQDAGKKPADLRVDGGASANGFLMQFQADMMNIPISRPAVLETTALGAAMLAGLACGVYADPQEALLNWRAESVFNPLAEEENRHRCLKGWSNAVETALFWARKNMES